MEKWAHEPIDGLILNHRSLSGITDVFQYKQAQQVVVAGFETLAHQVRSQHQYHLRFFAPQVLRWEKPLYTDGLPIFKYSLESVRPPSTYYGYLNMGLNLVRLTKHWSVPYFNLRIRL